MKYYLIAGERSGDLHGSNLMKQLALQDTQAEFRFFGGDYMKNAGGSLTVHYEQLAFMGFLEVIKNLGTIRKYLKVVKDDIQDFVPDAIILIDYAGFNLRVAKWAKKHKIKVLYYISPKLWAWNQKRAIKVKKYVDYMFVIMPFEVEFYKKFNFSNVSYVGNPVLDAINQYVPDPEFLEKHELAELKRKTIAILPGSRKQELQHILSVLTEVIQQNPELLFLVAQVTNLDSQLYQSLVALDNVKLITGHTYEVLAHSNSAIVTSGTATLETALWNVPQVVVYKGSALSIFIAKLLIKVKYISLVNLIMDKEVIRELVQEMCTPTHINKELHILLDNPTDYSGLREKIGNHNASENTATAIYNMLK